MKSRILEQLAGAQVGNTTEFAGSVPVDRGDDHVKGERSSINPVHIPYGVAPLLDIIVGSVEGIIKGCDRDEQP